MLLLVVLLKAHRNVIVPFLRILKSLNINFEYVRGNREISIFFKDVTKIVYVFGADNVDAENKLAGLTLQGILIDEASRVDKGFFTMALSRLSEDGAKAFITTNPDNYSHWLKTEYIDNLKESYMGSPTLYARFIESKWVSGAGLIYSNFNHEENTFDEIDLTKYDRIDIGCDYGSSNVNVFVVVGRYMSDGQSYHDILDKVVFDAQKMSYEQTDTDRCNDLFKLQKKYNLHNNSWIYVPHDATSLYAAVYRDERLLIQATKVKPDTLEYIYTLQNMFY